MAVNDDRSGRLVRLSLAAGALLSGGLGVDAAGAQSFSATGLTFGTPVRTLQVNASGEALYDSNVARANREGALRRRIKPRDVRLRPTLDANIVLPTDVAVLTLDASVGYDFYTRNSRLNRERVNATGGAATKVGVCDLGAQAGIARGQNDLSDISIVPNDVRTSSINVQTVVRVGGSATCGGGRIRPTAFVEYRHSNNSANLRKISNFDALSYGGGVSYSNPSFGVATLFVGRTEFDYPDRRAVLGTADEFNTTYVGIRLDRRLGARLQVNGQLTYVDVDIPGGGARQFSGLNWDVAAVLRAGERSQFTLGASRVVDASGGFNSRTARVSAYLAQFDYALSPLLRFSLTGQHRDRDFDVGPALTPVVLLGRDNIDEITGRLSYTLTQRTTASLSAGYQDRDADVAIYRYNSYRASVGVRVRI